MHDRPSCSALALAARRQLAARRRESRLAWSMRALLLVTVPTAIIAAVALLATLRERVAALLDALDAHALPAAFAVGAFAWTWARERRRRGERDHLRSWLAAAPVSAREVSAHLRRNAISAFGLPCIVTFATLVAIAFVAASDVRALLASSALAVVAGFAAGWRSGRHARPDAPPPPPRLSRRHAATDNAAHLRALQRWPFAQWLADAQPRQHAQVSAALLLAMPTGTAFFTALALVLLAAFALAAIGLLRALLAAIDHAGEFMRTTPLSARAFALNLAMRALAEQSLIACSAAALASGAGAQAATACGGAVAWLFACATLCALALHRQREKHR